MMPLTRSPIAGDAPGDAEGPARPGAAGELGQLQGGRHLRARRTDPRRRDPLQRHGQPRVRGLPLPPRREDSAQGLGALQVSDGV